MVKWVWLLVMEIFLGKLPIMQLLTETGLVEVYFDV